jgi:putative methanogenesis marker protein 2
MDLEKIVSDIRNYPGVTRKKIISDVVKHFSIPEGSGVIAHVGEDAAVIEHGESALLLAADGIMEDLMNKNPFWAGYCSVLVNVNDIAAMGGIPLGMVSIISMRKGEVLTKVLEGISEGTEKFGVPMVGGHTHPDCQYNAVDVAILGHVQKENVILSSTAGEGDSIIFAMDIDGSFTPKIPYSWDSTSHKTKEAVQRQILVMNVLAKKNLLTAGKDISNPGSLGTLGMLLETSGKGGNVEIAKIPKPEDTVLLQWLLAYQGCGFVVTCQPQNSDEVMGIFEDVGLATHVAGKITSGHRLTLIDGGESAVLFDFESDIITGCKR